MAFKYVYIGNGLSPRTINKVNSAVVFMLEALLPMLEVLLPMLLLRLLSYV